MKIGEIEVQGPNESVLHLPHNDGVITFRARALLDEDFDQFNALCPYPKPPVTRTKDGDKQNTSDPGFKQQVANWENQRVGWMVMTSLEPTGIEWSMVKPDKPGTWKHYRKELSQAGFGSIQIQRIVNHVMDANCLSESKMEWAREVFARGQQAPEDNPSCPSSELTSTESGEPAGDSE